MGKWENYLQTVNPDKVFNLGEIGLPEISVTLRNTARYTPVQMRDELSEIDKNWTAYTNAVEARITELQTKFENDDNMNEDEFVETLNGLGYSIPNGLTPFHQWMITGWTMTRPDTNEALDTPTNDMKVLYYVPVAVQNYITALIDAYLEDSRKTPKVTLTP